MCQLNRRIAGWSSQSFLFFFQRPGSRIPSPWRIQTCECGLGASPFLLHFWRPLALMAASDAQIAWSLRISVIFPCISMYFHDIWPWYSVAKNFFCMWKFTLDLLEVGPICCAKLDQCIPGPLALWSGPYWCPISGRSHKWAAQQFSSDGLFKGTASTACPGNLFSLRYCGRFMIVWYVICDMVSVWICLFL